MPMDKGYSNNPTDEGDVAKVVDGVAAMYKADYMQYPIATGPAMPISTSGFDLAPDPYDPTIPVRVGGPQGGKIPRRDDAVPMHPKGSTTPLKGTDY